MADETATDPLDALRNSPEEIKPLLDLAFQVGIRGGAKAALHYAGMRHVPALSPRVKKHLLNVAEHLERAATSTKLEDEING